MARALRSLGGLVLAAAGAACGSSHPASHADDTGDDGGVDGGAGGHDAAIESGPVVPADASYTIGDASVPASRFVTEVVSFTPTDCAGFGIPSMPRIVEGPPVGGGTTHGSTDVVSLGCGGSIVVGFTPNAIVDGPGPDFIVFENPFWIAGDSSNVYAEPGEVSVSDDGAIWTTFPCTFTVDPGASDGTGTAPPYGGCAGSQVTYSNPDNGISPLDPTVAGGAAYDLATIGVAHARYVRIVDVTNESCPAAGADKPTTNGFDLDAVAIVNAEMP